MERRIKIITDSVSDIPDNLVKELDIEVVPLTINFEDGTYKDRVDISVDEFYSKMEESKELPTTSQVPPMEFIETLNEYQKNYEYIMIITLSSKLSGTFQSAKTAIEVCNLEDRAVAIDSKGITLGQGLMVIEAARMAMRGDSFERIIERVNEMTINMEYIFVVDTLTNLRKGGRLSAGKAFVGEKLKIKPVLTVKNGNLVLIDKIRGRKKIVSWIIKKMKKRDIDYSNKTIGINHSNTYEFAVELKNSIESEFDVKEIIMSDVGATVGTHAGEGAVAVYFENIK